MLDRIPHLISWTNDKPARSAALSGVQQSIAPKHVLLHQKRTVALDTKRLPIRAVIVMPAMRMQVRRLLDATRLSPFECSLNPFREAADLVSPRCAVKEYGRRRWDVDYR